MSMKLFKLKTFKNVKFLLFFIKKYSISGLRFFINNVNLIKLNKPQTTLIKLLNLSNNTIVSQKKNKVMGVNIDTGGKLRYFNFIKALRLRKKKKIEEERDDFKKEIKRRMKKYKNKKKKTYKNKKKLIKIRVFRNRNKLNFAFKFFKERRRKKVKKYKKKFRLVRYFVSKQLYLKKNIYINLFKKYKVRFYRNKVRFYRNKKRFLKKYIKNIYSKYSLGLRNKNKYYFKFKKCNTWKIRLLNSKSHNLVGFKKARKIKSGKKKLYKKSKRFYVNNYKINSNSIKANSFTLFLNIISKYPFFLKYNTYGIDTSLKKKIKSFNKHYINKKQNDYFMKFMVNYLEMNFGKKILINVRTKNIYNSYREDSKFSEANQVGVLAQESLTRVLQRKVNIFEYSKVIYTMMLNKDLDLFVNYVKKIFKKIPLWKHKQFFLATEGILKMMLFALKRSHGIVGYHFEVRGKIGRAGKVRKKKIMKKVGNSSKSNYFNKISFVDTTLNTVSGVLSFRFWLYH